jgi:hypothetical protein
MPHPTGSPAVIFVAVTGVPSKLLKALIDPNAASVRSLSREERELMIAANSGYLLAFDNLSNLPVWLSDALCRLASGGSFAVRRLYSDDEEVLFKAARDQSAGSRRPGDFSDPGAHWRGATTPRERAVA